MKPAIVLLSVLLSLVAEQERQLNAAVEREANATEPNS